MPVRPGPIVEGLGWKMGGLKFKNRVMILNQKLLRRIFG